MSNDFKNEYTDYFKRGTCLESEYTQLLDVRNNAYYKQLSIDASNYLAFALSTNDLESKLSHYLSNKFNVSNNLWDKVIDRKYLETHVGGATLHHNLDGQHTFDGALQALREAFPDDNDFELVLKMMDHFARDLTTPSGINPFLNPDQFNATKDYLHTNFHIPNSHINDLLNQNASEIIALTIASMALLFEFNELEIDKLGQFATRFSLSGFVAGNPLMLVLTTVIVARICFCLWSGENIIQLLEGASKGVVTAGTFFLVATHFHPPILLGLALATLFSIAAGYIHNKVVSFIKEDFHEILKQQFPDFKSYVGVF